MKSPQRCCNIKFIHTKHMLNSNLIKSRWPRFQSSSCLKLCTEHGSDTAMLCAKFQDNLTTKQKVMSKQNFTFDMHFGRIPYTARAILQQPPCGMPLFQSLRTYSSMVRSVFDLHGTLNNHRVDSRFAPSQLEMALLCNDVSHWLCASLESPLNQYIFLFIHIWHIAYILKEYND